MTEAFILKNIAELLEVESEYARTTPAILNPFGPHLLEAFDIAIGMYRTFGRAIGDSAAFADGTKDFNAHLKALGATDEADLERIRVRSRSVRSYSAAEGEQHRYRRRMPY